jgi:predicted nucleic acid-binding protein
MAAYFLDSSAPVQRYVDELGSEWVRAICDRAAGHRSSVLRLAVAEVAGAFFRRRRERTLSDQEARDLLAQFNADCATQYEVFEVTRDLIGEAVLLMSQHPLRALDAVQLAAVSLANHDRAAVGVPPMAFVSADDRLCAVAATMGLQVENPNARRSLPEPGGQPEG